MNDDFYSIFGVAPTATASEIKERFRFLSHAYHPDKFATESQRRTAEHDFKRINEAYQVLSDSAQRSRYDAMRSRTSGPLPRNPQTYAPPSSPPRQKRRWNRIGLAALVIGLISVVIWLRPSSTATPFFTTALPGEQRERIFERFVRLGGSSSGSGLGLAISRSIVGLHRGRIYAEAAPNGRGLRVVFELPANSLV